jgi:type I restriction enzyme, S subunit
MNAKQAKYPQLRFKGFTDPWEKRKLGEISKTTIGEFVIKNKQDSDAPYPVYNGGISYTGFYDEFNNEGDKIVISARGANAGFVNYIDGRFWAGNSCYSVDILDRKKFSVEFMYQFLKRNQHLFTDYQQAANIPSVSKKDVATFIVQFPTQNEQREIASFFKQLDNLITLHQRKLAKLKELKQGYLQKLFPQNGSKFPQLRFAGFADAWEQRKLGEEAQLTMGQSPNSENYTKNPDDYILVQGNADMKNGRVVSRVWTTQITKKAEKSDLILSVRAPVGDIGKTDYDVVLGRGVAAIKGNEFIFQQLGKMKLTGYWTRYSTGSTFESINSNDIKDAKIMVPVEEEQQKIGSFFQQLDHLITLHQRKLEKLQELKKGYLQKMFC